MEADANTSTKQETTAPAPPPPPPRMPALPWTVRFQLFVLVAATDIAQREDGTVNRFAFSLADRQARARPRPDAKSGVRSVDVTVDASRGLWARVFSPTTSPASTHVTAAPRGGVLPRRRVRALLRGVGPAGRHVRAPLCRARSAPSWSRAGGNIAHHVAHRWTSTSSSSPELVRVRVRLAGVVLIQPFFGGEERTGSELRLEGVAPVVSMRRADWSWRAFLPRGGDGAGRNHPAAHVTGEAAPEPELAEGFPPAVVVVGGFDPLQDWQRRYAAMLRRKGKAVRVVELPDAFHGFYIFPELHDAGRLVQEIKAFVEETESTAGGAE
ncbi:hypothetical protein PR202_gb21852 [Eleusine coracana subsp. coracana]|uniref:Alpha/beta hydrolase fold-3 domain-containing protein n=1 Tax=Eleusine coracana subsp. coracana TaxID=191504 RepID=A0AAV5FEF9_ELECO|nr:hypothetical protein PR202_gb21852 [Eleusine coracana subsp. coracana]